MHLEASGGIWSHLLLDVNAAPPLQGTWLFARSQLSCVHPHYQGRWYGEYELRVNQVFYTHDRIRCCFRDGRPINQ